MLERWSLVGMGARRRLGWRSGIAVAGGVGTHDDCDCVCSWVVCLVDAVIMWKIRASFGM